MYLTSYTPAPDPYVLTYIALKNGKSPFNRSSGIHSTNIRQHVFTDHTNYGKLRKGFIGNATPGQMKKSQLEKLAETNQKQNWKKEISVNVNEEPVEKGLEKGLLEYLSSAKSIRPQTSTSSYKSLAFPGRAQTSADQQRMTLTSPSVKSMGRLHSASEKVLRRDVMCSTKEVDVNAFTDDYAGEKYRNLVFINAPSKEYLKLLKLSNFDVSLVPNDSRRTILEAIMRDYFLNLIPENSDFLICKNSQSQIYTIIFTGRLVPTCRACSSITQFELSKDLGFRIICSSQYCSVKVLFRTSLSNYTIECLWPKMSRPDVELSVRPKEKIVKTGISKLIQSGKYKRADFSRVFLDQNTPNSDNVNVRPNTTSTVMRTTSSMPRMNRMIIQSTVSDLSGKQTDNTGKRPNTVQGIMKTLGSRPGTANSIELNDFKGMPILKELELKGLFARDNERIMGDVIEEMPGDEEIIQIMKMGRDPVDFEDLMRKSETEKSRPPTSFSVQSRPRSRKEREDNRKVRFEPYAMQIGKKLIARGKTVEKFDNSFDDIHNMVALMTSKDSKTGI